MLLDDPVVKARLKEYAKTNDINMFIKLFSNEFQRVLVECFMQNDEAFNRLLNDANSKNCYEYHGKGTYKLSYN